MRKQIDHALIAHYINACATRYSSSHVLNFLSHLNFSWKKMKAVVAVLLLSLVGAIYCQTTEQLTEFANCLAQFTTDNAANPSELLALASNCPNLAVS